MSQDEGMPTPEGGACLSIDSAQAYIEDGLSSEDRAVLESHLADCRLCQDAIEGMQQYRNFVELRRSLDSLEKSIELRSSTEALARNR